MMHLAALVLLVGIGWGAWALVVRLADGVRAHVASMGGWRALVAAVRSDLGWLR